MSNFEGIFKTKRGIFERVDGEFNKLNLTSKIYEKCSNSKFIYALNDKQHLCPITFKNSWEKRNYIDQFKDLKPIYYFDDWIEYVNTKYWKKELPEPRIMYLDIETIDLNDRKFPQPHLAKAPITHIQLMDSKTKKVIILYLKEPSEKIKNKYKDVNLIKCSDEYNMLDKFAKILQKLNPSIVTAYNGALFDFPYIYFRAMKLKFPIERLSPLGEVTFRIEFKNLKTGEYKKYYNVTKLKEFLNDNNLEEWKIVVFQINVKGIYFLDYLEVFKTFTYEDLPSYKLEYLAYKFLKEGEGKVSYGQYSSIFEFYEKNYDGFFEYAIQDPIVLYNLEHKLKLLDTLTLIAYLMGCNYDTALATVQPWAIHLRHIGLKQNVILPNDTKHKLEKSIAGGYVKEPIKGRHSWLFSYDFNSLYPSIMDMLNLCGTTYIPYEELPNELKEIYDLFRDENEKKLLEDKNLRNKIRELTHKYNVSFNGQGFFKRNKRGMVAQVVADIYYQRKEEKTKMLLSNAILKNKKGSIKLEIAKIIEKIESNEITWDNVYNIVILNIENKEKLEEYSNQKKILQQALKILINSLYGALSNTSFILFNRDIAAGITFTGRFLNRYTGMKIAEYLKEKYNISDSIIYQDTDSVTSNTKLKIKNLYKVTLKNGEIRYITKEQIDELKRNSN